MIKTFLSVLFFFTFTLSAKQILLVMADDFNTTKGVLWGFEDEKIIFSNISVNLGKNGLGWGIGLVDIKHKSSEPVKHEGDKKAPAGIFQLQSVFGYDENVTTAMPYLHVTKELICVDESDAKEYNQIFYTKESSRFNSFEKMLREDGQYRYGVVVNHNQNGIKRRGSCIFLHIQKSADHPTVGCTSMQTEDMLKIIKWLDPEQEPILIQIPKHYLPTILDSYPMLKSLQQQH
jgi:hypothetical protein